MDDPNAWDCSLCTYKNKPEAFRCSMCSGRKGTSTRKPRINQEVVTQQVLRQQEQIKQQALKAAAKPRDKVRRIDENSNSSIASTSSSRASPSPHSGNSSSNGSNSFLGTSSSFRTASKSNTVHRKAREVFDEIDDEEDEEEEEVDENDIHQPGPSRRHNGHTNAGCNGNKNGKRKRDKRSRGDSLQRKKRVRVLAPPKPVPEADRTHGVVSREVKVNNICVKVTEYRLKPEFFEHFKVPEKVKILSPIKLPTTHTPTPTAHANSARGRIKPTKNGSNRRRPP